MSATLTASLSTQNPAARLTVRQTRIPLFPGGEPLEVSVGRDIPLSPKTSVVEEWIELGNRLMGVPVS